MQVLSRFTKNNPVLVGAPGMGKTAVVEGLAQKIVKSEVPAILRDKQLCTLVAGWRRSPARQSACWVWWICLARGRRPGRARAVPGRLAQ